MKAIFMLMVVALASPAFGQTRGNLEVPANHSWQSGIGFMSGWVCRGRNVEIVLNGVQRIPVARNIARGDTEAICGDTENGFITQWNWNLLGDSRHTAALVVDGRTIQENEFTVTTLGEEFVRGAAADVEVQDFPSPGESVRLHWQEATQGFVISVTRPPTVAPVVYPPGILPLSTPGSARSFLPPNNYLGLIRQDTKLETDGDWNISATGITWDTLTAIRAYVISPGTTNELLSLTRGPDREAALRQSTIQIRDIEAGKAPRHQTSWAYALVGRPTQAGNVITIPIRQVFESRGVLPTRGVGPADLTIGYNVWYVATEVTIFP